MLWLLLLGMAVGGGEEGEGEGEGEGEERGAEARDSTIPVKESTKGIDEE